MALQLSGQITMGDIAAEYSVSCANTSLRNLASCASLTIPDAMSEFYGLSDVVLSTVSTQSPSSVTATTMTLNGNLTNLGGGSISSHGFYFGTSSTYSSNTKINLGSKASTGTFTSARTGLTHSTTYYATAFAVNEAGESVGTTVSQTTSWGASCANINADSFMCNDGFNPPVSACSDHAHYYQENYSGPYLTAYSGTSFNFAGKKCFGQHGPTTRTVYTNTNNRIVFGIAGTNQDNNGYIHLVLNRDGSRTFTNCSVSIPIGSGNIDYCNLTTTQLYGRNRINSPAYCLYLQHEFRYS